MAHSSKWIMTGSLFKGQPAKNIKMPDLLTADERNKNSKLHINTTKLRQLLHLSNGKQTLNAHFLFRIH